jgi:hypothetical protein
MDFRIKIDLSNQSIINNTPSGEKKKKKFDRSKKLDNSEIKTPEISKKKKNILRMIKTGKDQTDLKENFSQPQTPIQIEKPRLNTSSLLSLSLPYNENSKTDQAQKLSLITKKKPKHWEKRWVLIPNVFEFTKEIWLKKWVLVDGGDDISDTDVFLYF